MKKARFPLRRLSPVLLVLACAPSAMAQIVASVEIVGAAPLGGFTLPVANVVVLDEHQLSGGATVADALAARLGSLQLGQTQGNPFQPDVQYRGFTASPLLGTPQGLSVFVDGVRMNAPFGDVVNWDLIPRHALRKATLFPGANPVYGLNTLGGALALDTKHGRSDAGSSASAAIGSFGRRELAFEHGGHGDLLDWYAAASLYRERGWRAASPSAVRQLFGKLRRRERGNESSISLALADTDMNGNGLVPESFARADRRQAYTVFDNTRNRSWLLDLSHATPLGTDADLRAKLYARRIATATINNDINQIEDARFDVEPFEEDPEPGVNEAAVNRSQLRQRGAGFSMQANLGLAARSIHQAVAGLAFDTARTGFARSYQLGAFNAERSVRGLGNPTDINDLDGSVHSLGLYGADTVRVGSTLHLTLSGRYNAVRVVSRDRLENPLVNAETPGTNDPNFNSDYRYPSFNPAFGASWQLAQAATLYANLSRGSRAPSPIELACADPHNACLLPNQMASDPYLAQVRTTSVEAGLRGRTGRALRWNASAYRAANRDDILFISTSSGGAGYFSNVGRTRRQGLELGASGRHAQWEWSADYGLTDATYQTEAVLLSPANSSSDSGGRIAIRPGHRLPGVARHALKLGWERAGERWTLGGQAQAYSSQYARGNENNAHRESAAFGGSGRVGGYALLNLHAAYRGGAGIEWYVRVDNALDRRHASTGLLGENAFPGGVFDASGANPAKETFIAPGAPRSFVFGVRFRK